MPLRRLLVTLIATFALLAPASAFAADATVTVSDAGYSDNTSTTTTSSIKVGEKVTWNWTSALPHSVTFTDEAFDSGAQIVGATAEHTFATAGQFKYYDTSCGTYNDCPASFKGLVIVDGPPVAVATGPGSAERGQIRTATRSAGRGTSRTAPRRRPARRCSTRSRPRASTT
jgi:plastocyanin